MRALALALALVLPGCLPVAMLRPPEPARGAEFSLGATLMPNPFGGQSPVLLLPYLAHAEGDGTLEYNLSLQWGLRGGVKVGLAPGVALDAGLTLPPALGEVADWSWGVPVVLDGGSSWAGEATTSRPGFTSSGSWEGSGGWPTSFPRGSTAGAGWRRWGPWARRG